MTATRAEESAHAGVRVRRFGAERPLKVLHVAEAFSTGVFEVVRQLANAAVVRGHEVHVAHSQRRWTPPAFESMFAEAVVFHRLGWSAERRPWPLLRATAQLAALVRRQRYDLIHLHSTFAGVTGAVARPRRVPTIYTPHGYAFLIGSLSTPAQLAVRAAERIVGRRVSVVGAVSESEAKEARGLGLPRVSVIRNGIAELNDRSARTRGYGIANAERRGVVAAGRMSAQRQPLAVAEILAALPREAPKGWIGDPGDDESVRALEASGTSITGWRPREEVLEITRRARVYLHWSAWDGNPLSVLEALSVGTVVVGHDIPPVREILGERWVHRRPEAAAAMIERLLVDDDFFASVQLAQARAAAPFTARSMAEQWCELSARLTRRTDPERTYVPRPDNATPLPAAADAPRWRPPAVGATRHLRDPGALGAPGS